MKYIITTVGTSAIEKARVSTDNFKGEDYKFFDTFKSELTKKKKQLLEHFRDYDVNNAKHLRALPVEIKSLAQLRCDKDTFNYLIVTDTAECRLCGEFLRDYLKEKFNSESKVLHIKGLRVDDLETFRKEGMYNLVEELGKINDSHYENKFLNITGGYKATIPYLTILGQIWNIPLYYIFEEMDNLIEIPNIPIDIDWELFKKYSDRFYEIGEKGIDNGKNLKNKFEYRDLPKVTSLIYVCENMAEFSPMGQILWKKFKSRYHTFFVTKEVKKKINEDKNSEKVLKKFANSTIRSQHIDSLREVDIKPFKVFKLTGKGEKIHRIVFKEEEGKVFISHIFSGSEVHGSDEYISKLKGCNWSGITFPERITIEKDDSE